MAVTKLRGRQTRASEKYDPSGTGLASDSEVEARIRKHSELYHHNRNDVTKLYFDTNENLTDIKTYNDSNENVLLAHSAFEFIDGNLSKIIKKVYENNGAKLYMHLEKIFSFDINGNLESIANNKIV